MNRILGVALIVVLSGISCRKPDQYSFIPTLTYKSLTFTQDSSGSRIFTLVATFTDGDGDIGYNQEDFSDPNSPYNSNFVIRIQRLVNGTWSDSLHYHVLGDTLNWKDSIFPITCRIPYITPDGKNKGLKGDITKSDYLPLGLNDTIRFTAFLYDRALHKSNTIIVPDQGGYFIQIP